MKVASTKFQMLNFPFTLFLVLMVLRSTYSFQFGGSSFPIREPSASAKNFKFPFESSHSNNGFTFQKLSLKPQKLRGHKCILNLSGPSNENNQISPELKLVISLLIDFIGVSSFAAPGLGEATDIAWAPVSALLINYLYGNSVVTSLAFVEEFLPGLDFIPTATIGWFLENYNSPQKETRIPSESEIPKKAADDAKQQTSKLNEGDFIDVDFSNNKK